MLYLDYDAGPFVYLGGLLILMVLNILNSINLYKKGNDKELKFSTITTTFGPLLFYAGIVLFFLILGEIASNYLHAILAAVGVNLFIHLPSVLNFYLYIRKRGYSRVHILLAMLPFVSVIDLIYLLIKEKRR